MYDRAIVVLALTAFVGACTAPVGTEPDPARCESLFRDFDTRERFYVAHPSPFDEGRPLDTGLTFHAQRLLQSGCISQSRYLDGLSRMSPGLAATSGVGQPIRPISVHLGVITSITDEARVRQVFESLGYNVRSVGQQDLGRRIYLGPFAFSGDVERAIEAGRAAGFISPYPKRF